MSLQKVDLPLPLAPSSATRSSGARLRLSPREHDPVRVARLHPLHGDDGRRERTLRARQAEGRHVVLDHRGDDLHLGETLDAGLGLARLRGLRLEPVDEALEMRPLRILLGLRLRLEHALLGDLPGEGGVAAPVDAELAAVEMQDVIDAFVEQVAVVGDDDGGARITLQVVVEPDRPLDIEGSWWARRGGAGRVRRTARRPAPRACAIHPRNRNMAAPAPPRRSRGRAGWRRRGRAPNAPRYPRAGSRSRPGAGHRQCSASAIRRARSVSAASTTECSVSGPAGASCATAPMRMPLGIETVPPSVGNSPRIALNSVVLPAPLRPTSPTRARSGMTKVAPSRIRRSPMR